MKKEIEVYVNENSIGDKESGEWSTIRTSRTPNKATLIMEEPEPEVSITRSEFVKLFWEGVESQVRCKRAVDYMTNKLFGEKEGEV